MFELRGPESFASPAALFVLERSRLSSIFAALVLHRPTIFAQPCWKYIPWGLSPDRKTPLQYLLDIMADCPDLFVSKDRVCTGVAEQQTGSEYKLLAGRAQRLLEDLCQWEQTWTALHSECSHEHLSPPTTPTFTDPRGRIAPIWSTVLQYKSWYHASAVTLYNSTRILLVKFILSLSRPKDEFSAEDQDLSEAMLASGLTICRSVDFCLEEISAGEGSFSLLFSLRMAFDAVGRSNQEIRAWLRAILHRISSGSVSRWPAAKYVLEINASMI